MPEKTAALAGLFQTAHLVDKLASSGHFVPASYDVLIASLFKFDAQDVATIYDGQVNPIGEGLSTVKTSQSLSSGIRVLHEVIAENQSVYYANTIRYVLALIQLENSFSKRQDLQNKIQSELSIIGQKLGEYDSLHSELLSESISQLYVDTLGTLTFRIQITGKMQHLQNKENENRIRSLLLAGIRSAMLWKQLGGRRWHLLLQKGQIIKALDQIKHY